MTDQPARQTLRRTRSSSTRTPRRTIAAQIAGIRPGVLVTLTRYDDVGSGAGRRARYLGHPDGHRPAFQFLEPSQPGCPVDGFEVDPDTTDWVIS